MYKKIILSLIAISLLAIFGMVKGFADENGKYTGIVKKIESENFVVENLEVKQEKNEPVSYILDTDFSDINDICALQMASIYNKENTINLKAVCLCTKGTKLIDGVEGILDYNELFDVPIGVSSVEENSTSPYWDTLASYKSYSHTTRDVIALYKEVLSNNPKTIIVTTGYTTNIATLLRNSETYDLIKEKCKAIYIQGGSYPNGWSDNFGYTPESIEAVRFISKNCPVPVYFIINNTDYLSVIDEYLQYDVTESPLYKVLSAYDKENGFNPSIILTSIQRNNTKIIPVKFEIDDNGVNTFTETSNKTNTYVVLRDANDEKIKNEILSLL